MESSSRASLCPRDSRALSLGSGSLHRTPLTDTQRSVKGAPCAPGPRGRHRPPHPPLLRAVLGLLCPLSCAAPWLVIRKQRGAASPLSPGRIRGPADRARRPGALRPPARGRADAPHLPPGWLPSQKCDTQLRLTGGRFTHAAARGLEGSQLHRHAALGRDPERQGPRPATPALSRTRPNDERENHFNIKLHYGIFT